MVKRSNGQASAEKTVPSSQTVPEYISGRVIITWCVQALRRDPRGQLCQLFLWDMSWAGPFSYTKVKAGLWGPRSPRLFLNPINLLVALPVLSLEL